MMGLFTRRPPSAATSGLGATLIACRLAAGEVAPAGVTLVIFNPAGQARRLAGGRVSCQEGEVAYGFHAGPYSIDLLPFGAAPEVGLRLRFAVDSANPRVLQQRFDLYLFSEAGPQLTLSAMRQALEGALQDALAQGALDLPPCTSLDEWNAFRAGLNQLLYTRFGITVDDCVPVDLGDQVDYAALLRERAAQQPLPAGSPVNAPAGAGGSDTVLQAPQHLPQPPSELDARALRRLFLELPALGGALRMLPLPPGLQTFQSHQSLLQRLALLALAVNTMPSLAWAAPDQPLALAQQQRRSAHASAASAALDECWTLLARLQLASAALWPPLLDDADRLCANLEFHLEQRRLASAADCRAEPVL